MTRRFTEKNLVGDHLVFLPFFTTETRMTRRFTEINFHSVYLRAIRASVLTFSMSSFLLCVSPCILCLRVSISPCPLFHSGLAIPSGAATLGCLSR